MRVWDWSLPPTGAHREVLSVIPEGWHDSPRATRTPPLLFIHGLSHGAWCFAEHWLPAAAERGYPAYAVSLRGHGGSGGGTKLHRTVLRHYVHDVMQAITDLPQPPVIVGHSMGALVAQLVAERYPAPALVLLTPAPMTGAGGSLLRIARERPIDALRTVAGGTLPLRPQDLFTGLEPSTAARYADRLGRESPWVQYQLLGPRRIGPTYGPVLVVGTRQDRIIREVDVEATAAAYGTTPTWLPAGPTGRPIGHDVMLDAGWEVALDTVLGWVEHQSLGRLG
jgi:pimeloyl-ACP methyl ester carboxylesterase